MKTTIENEFKAAMETIRDQLVELVFTKWSEAEDCVQTLQKDFRIPAEVEQAVITAAQQGNAEAQYIMGGLLDIRDEYQQATAWYRKAARNGHAEAAYAMALYAEADGEESQAELWREKAAAEGHALAEAELADGEEADCESSWWRGISAEALDQPARAARHYRRAAEQGHADAQAALGRLYRTGTGVALDLEKAEEWYTRAYRQWHAGGYAGLACLYIQGQGDRRTYRQSLDWFTDQIAAASSEGLMLHPEPRAVMLEDALEEIQGALESHPATRQPEIDEEFRSLIDCWV